MLVLLWLWGVGVAGGEENPFCGESVCKGSKDHTLCRFPIEGASAACGGYVEAALSEEESRQVVLRLNNRRRRVASGLAIRGHLSTAGDMLKLHWSEELAVGAQRWADQCIEPSMPERHDLCRDFLGIYKDQDVVVGQCVASVLVGLAEHGKGLRPESLVDTWYMQAALYTGNDSFYEPSERYADFAQIIWSRARLVGCGRSRFMITREGDKRSYGVERLVCNIAPGGPPRGVPLWLRAPPAAVCPYPTRPALDIPELCDYNIDSDVQESSSSSNIQDTYSEDKILLKHVTRDSKIFEDDYKAKLAMGTHQSGQGTELPGTYNLNSSGSNKQNEVKSKAIVSSINRRFMESPQPYKIEELTIGNVIYNKNDDEITELTQTTTERMNHVDEEYEMQSIREDIVTAPVLATTPKKKEPDKRKITNMLTTFTLPVQNNHMPNRYDDGYNLERPLEEYFNDPETAHLLQEALYGKEKLYHLTQPPEQEKMVQRELREDGERSKRAEPAAEEQYDETTLSTTTEASSLRSLLASVPFLGKYSEKFFDGAMAYSAKDVTDHANSVTDHATTIITANCNNLIFILFVLFTHYIM